MYKTKNDWLNKALEKFDDYDIQKKVSLITALSVQLVEEDVPEDEARKIVKQYKIM